MSIFCQLHNIERIGAHSKVECDFGVPLVDKLVEAGLLVGFESVRQGGCGDGRHKAGKKADDQSCETHVERVEGSSSVLGTPVGTRDSASDSGEEVLASLLLSLFVLFALPASTANGIHDTRQVQWQYKAWFGVQTLIHSYSIGYH